MRRFGELVSCYHAPCKRLIASKLDLNMRRFGQKCDHVQTNMGDPVACATARAAAKSLTRSAAYQRNDGQCLGFSGDGPEKRLRRSPVTSARADAQVALAR